MLRLLVIAIVDYTLVPIHPAATAYFSSIQVSECLLTSSSPFTVLDCVIRDFVPSGSSMRPRHAKQRLSPGEEAIPELSISRNGINHQTKMNRHHKVSIMRNSVMI
jgi:hypothetical protein